MPLPGLLDFGATLDFFIFVMTVLQWLFGGTQERPYGFFPAVSTGVASMPRMSLRRPLQAIRAAPRAS